MTPTTKHHLENLQNKDANSRYASFQYLIEETQKRVDWVYDAWENLLLYQL